jgi:hypothetical protein
MAVTYGDLEATREKAQAWLSRSRYRRARKVEASRRRKQDGRGRHPNSLAVLAETRARQAAARETELLEGIERWK